MKTYEIKTSRSRWTSLVIAALLIVMVAMMCMPYFNYGENASTFAPAAGNGELLEGKWIIAGTEAGTDGYKEIEFVDGKTMTVTTTNIIRVQQIAADAAVNEAVKAYNEAVKAVEATDVANQKVQAYAKSLEVASGFITGFTANDVVVEGLSFEYFQSEIEGITANVPAGAPVVVDAEAIAEIQANAAKSYTKLEKHISDAQKSYDEAVAALETAKANVENAIAGAIKTYEADASYAWVTEDADKFNAAFEAANPELVADIIAENAAAVDAFNKATEEYNNALAKTNEAKAKYEELQKAALAKIADSKAVLDEATAASETALSDLKKAYEAQTKELKANVETINAEYIAAIDAANAEIKAIVDEFAAATESEPAEYNKKIADKKAEYAESVAAAKAKCEADLAANETAIADAKTAYEANVTSTKAANDAKVAEAQAAYDAAVKTVENEYLSAKTEYQSLKKTSDALKKAIPSKVALYTEADVTKAVVEIAGTNEALDNNVYNKLAAEKAKAAEGYALCNTIVKDSEKLVKEAQKVVKNAEKPVTNFEKEYVKYVAFADQLKAGSDFALAKPDVAAAEIAALEIQEYEKTSTEPETMVTTGKYKFDAKKNKLTLTFANGDVIETSYSTEVSYNGVKELSVLGYIGFPYNVTDFTDEMTYKLPGYYINDVILVPIVLLVLAIVGVVFCFLKKDKMSSAYLPVAFGLVGLIGYATSDFLKLGEKFSTHMIGFAVIFVIAVLHIVLSIKEKKAK